MIIGHKEFSRGDRIEVIGCTNERMPDGPDIRCLVAVQHVPKDFDLGSCWWARSGFIGKMIDGVNVDGLGVVRVGHKVDTMCDEGQIKVDQV